MFGAARKGTSGRSWCPHCAGKARLSLAHARDLAAARGGQCLSDRYVNSRSSLRWRCANGHEWNARLGNVKYSGTWCPECNISSGRLGVDVAKAVAAARGGKCLSASYTNNATPLLWQCKHGHTWQSSLANVQNQGSWCPRCACIARRLGIGVARKVAKARGGACLSESYTSNYSPLHWQCAEGHEWVATLGAVKDNGTWCPQCASRRSEREIRHILETIFCGHYFPTCRPHFLRGSAGRCLELDGYCAALCLAFEYNGEQHYDPTSFFNRFSASRFPTQVARDQKKIALCKAAGIRLIVVPCMARDRWNFVRTSLLRWFQISAIFPVSISH